MSAVRTYHPANRRRRDQGSNWPTTTQRDRRRIGAEAVHATGECLKATGVVAAELVGWWSAIVKTFAEEYMEHFVKYRCPPEILGRKPGQTRGGPERTAQIDHIGFDGADNTWVAVAS